MKFDLMPKNTNFKLKIFQSFLLSQKNNFSLTTTNEKWKSYRFFFSIFISKATMNRLDITEDALPVRLLIHHHVINVEKWRNSSFIPKFGESNFCSIICFKHFQIFWKRFLKILNKSYSAVWNAIVKFCRLLVGDNFLKSNASGK